MNKTMKKQLGILVLSLAGSGLCVGCGAGPEDEADYDAEIVELEQGLQSLGQAQAVANAWKPSPRSCHQDVVRPIAHAWRTANYAEKRLEAITEAIEAAEKEGCIDAAKREEIEDEIAALEEGLGAAYDPLGTAMGRIDECTEYLSEGLIKLVRDRSADLKDRIFVALRSAADLSLRLRRLPDCE